MDKNFKKINESGMEEVGGGNIFHVNYQYVDPTGVNDYPLPTTFQRYLVPDPKKKEVRKFKNLNEAREFAIKCGMNANIVASGNHIQMMAKAKNYLNRSK